MATTVFTIQNSNPIDNAHRLGYYVYQWSLGHRQIIHPGLFIELPKIYMNDQHVSDPFNIKVKIVAEGSKRIYPSSQIKSLMNLKKKCPPRIIPEEGFGYYMVNLSPDLAL
ncbi:hypothetical protein B5G50_00030 [Brevibacillus brevis]|nr:hypothetical protein B5G50_00030 [Brevibacillus brevis]